ncbi:hypothetical protein jhhlp_003470 [Lomentospora prolificans]|uniref:Vps52/Sac2 family protein n=1 Tax=Lomentospora prolificans TaxID=41688 RepID=A0A2N3N8U3_9PEZI|nr:hypothetical protein jhhlp_003470 [Lomentospora prolificans]
MWLDRLTQAGSGPSSQTPRSYSPLPRRTSGSLNPYVTSQRAGQSPRASTISLVSDASTLSLLGSTKKANGSSAKPLTTSISRPPEETLTKLLGTEITKSDFDNSTFHSIAPADLSLDFDFTDLPLLAVAASVRGTLSSPTSNILQPSQDSELETTALEALHTSIAECDNVLRSVETNFTSFRNDLATVSADIETLQTRSTALNVRLENRQAVERALGPVIEELSVSPVLVARVVEGPIDEAWIKALMEVDRRVAAYRKETSGSVQSKAWSDLGPLLDKLVVKAIERIRDHLVSQIKALRSPNINAQVIQQQSFFRFKDAYSFLYRHHPTLGDEICLAYMNTIRWYYLSHFTRYYKALDKLKLHVLDKHDVLGHEDTSRKASLLSTAKSTGPQHDAFNLGRRIDILKTKTQTALPSYLAEESKVVHYIEIPFRNFNLTLADNASAEYTFLFNFFSPQMSVSKIAKNFNYIFEPTFALGQALTKMIIGETYDGLGLLLCIRLNQRFAFELQRRKVPTMDGYINGTNMLLWPRLQLVIDHHCESIRQLTNSASSRPAARSASEQAKLSAAPHVVTQRFGQLLQGILTLCAEAGDDEPLITSIRRLRAEVEAFLTKQSKQYGDKRKQERFLYNNYSLIMTIISDTEGRMSVDQQEYFEHLKESFQDASA